MKVMKEFPDGEWYDCLSNGQIDSKLFVINELEKLDINLGLTFIYGGWYGTLANLILESNIKCGSIRSFDLDPACHEIAETLNRPFVLDGWKFKATTTDIFDITYPFKYETFRRDGSGVFLEELPNTIINTSCEHMSSDWFYRIPGGTLVVLQTNDFEEIEEHINCVINIEDMKSKYPLNKTLYEGKLRLNGYTRYMLIGFK